MLNFAPGPADSAMNVVLVGVLEKEELAAETEEVEPKQVAGPEEGGEEPAKTEQGKEPAPDPG